MGCRKGLPMAQAHPRFPRASPPRQPCLSKSAAGASALAPPPGFAPRGFRADSPRAPDPPGPCDGRRTAAPFGLHWTASARPPCTFPAASRPAGRVSGACRRSRDRRGPARPGPRESSRLPPPRATPPASLPLGPTPRARNHSAGRRREPPARGRSQGTGDRAWVPPGSRGGPNPSKPRGGARPWPTPRDRPAAGGPHGAARKPHGAWTCETHGRTTTQDPGHVAPRERPGPGKNEEPGPATQKPTRPRRGPNSAAGAQDTLERTEAQDPGPQRASRRIAGRIPWTRTRDRLFTKRFWVHRKTKKTQRFSPKTDV